MKRISVLLADDQRLFAESLSILLKTYANDIDVVGIAENGKEAVSLCDEKVPDVVLLDVRMPVMDGVKAAKAIIEAHQKIRVMMLSTFDEDEYVKEALHAGAAGYLLKDISPTELIVSIRAIVEGTVQISPSIAEKLVDKMYGKSDNEEPKVPWYRLLSKREREIFKLIAKGYGNKQIAQELFIAEQTVRNYVSSIYTRLDISDRFQLIRLANSAEINLEEEG